MTATAETSASPAFERLVEDFEFLDDWEDRYRYVIELAKELGEPPEGLHDPSHLVKGCASQVWLDFRVPETDAERLGFAGDSDAMLVKGLIAVLRRLFHGRPRAEIEAVDAMAQLARLGLDEALSPQRSNGLRAMVKRIQAEAATRTP